MNNSPPPEKKNKKGFPGGFLIFLIAAIFLILTMQNLSNESKGRVSFSHQVEHLVNLDLIHPEESKQISLNDNLVTFQGKFRDQLTEEARNRYRFLELLNKHHKLASGRGESAEEARNLQQQVYAASEQYLSLRGEPLPKEGYQVVSPIYDSKDRINAVVITKVAFYPFSLAALKKKYEQINPSSTEEVDHLGANVLHLIDLFRAPILGIGDEGMKQKLIQMQKQMTTVLPDSQITSEEKMASIHAALAGLGGIVHELDVAKDHVRLQELRSVRNYLVELSQFQSLSEQLVSNEAQLDRARQNVSEVNWFFNNKEMSTKTLEKQDFETFSRFFAQAKLEWENFANNQGSHFKAPDQPRNLVLEKTFKSQEPSPNYLSYIFTVLPILLIVLLLYVVFSRQMKGMGSNAMNFGKSPARMLNQSLQRVTFKDVAGVDEAKEELQELVEFLKYPDKFTALGARIPKGVLCIGPPGTGKTLIAKAVAGEADRPFFSISGSDFVEMFVGVGASRIRDLFNQAKKNSPCIVFIDEIDAVGRHRGAGIGGGHDEREQTLNQLLVEMDGFDTNEGVILIAATNRPDVLDKALLRPGRFDRHIVLDLPDIKGRYAILKVHARKVKLDADVELMDVARATVGASGADLMNILNEAALIAARKGRKAVINHDCKEAADKVIYGKERRSLELDKKEKLHTAYHESGHAIVGLRVKYSDPIEKVTIVPRGMSLGATYFLPEKNKVSRWRKELLDRLAVLMGGRIAEEEFVKDVSSGAQSDIAVATNLARAMVCKWGMTETLGSVAYEERAEGGQYFLPGQTETLYSNETAKQIDDEVRKLLGEANKRAKEIIQNDREKVQLMTDMLMEFEMLDKEDVHAILEGKWDIEKKRQKLEKIKNLHTTPVNDVDKKRGPSFDPLPQES